MISINPNKTEADWDLISSDKDCNSTSFEVIDETKRYEANRLDANRLESEEKTKYIFKNIFVPMTSAALACFAPRIVGLACLAAVVNLEDSVIRGASSYIQKA